MQTVRRQLDRLFAVHMVIAVVTGALCFLTPHSLMSPMLGEASNTHLAHEFVRLYGMAAAAGAESAGLTLLTYRLP
jgi:Na+-driven multidrug efflux pump